MSENSDLFIKEKPVKALIVIQKRNGESYCSEVSEAIDSTYAHTVKIISKMVEIELVDTRKEGRKKMLSLTEKGEEQAIALIKLMELYDKDSTGENERIEKNLRNHLGETSTFS